MDGKGKGTFRWIEQVPLEPLGFPLLKSTPVDINKIFAYVFEWLVGLVHPIATIIAHHIPENGSEPI